MNKADKIWIAIGCAGVVVVRDRRAKKRIKELKKLVELLNLENEFLHAFIGGFTNPDTNKDEILKSLSEKFQFITLVKDF